MNDKIIKEQRFNFLADKVWEIIEDTFNSKTLNDTKDIDIEDLVYNTLFDNFTAPDILELLGLMDDICKWKENNYEESKS